MKISDFTPNTVAFKKFWIAGGISLYLGATTPATAQFIQIDGTTPTLPGTCSASCTITGGTAVGSNLFHSFLKFNVDPGQAVLFYNPTGITNIFSRVTGNTASNIQGMLGVSGGNANLFLMNPNGIIFGPNASLSVNGSFVATTANAIRLSNGEIFSTNPNVALPNQILNVNPSALLFNQIAAQPTNSIEVNGNGATLSVPKGQSLLLVGGNVNLNYEYLAAPGGRIELGGLANSGTVRLSFDSTGSILSLSFPEGVARADISLNKAGVDVTTDLSGGSIAINAGNVGISGEVLAAGINENKGAVGAVAGDITVNATGTVALSDSSVIKNTVSAGATGNAGNINVVAGSLNLISASQLDASTLGNGNAGSVNINARNTVSLDGVNTQVFSSVAQRVMGNAGDINIRAGSLSLTNGAQLNPSNQGTGKAGNVNINAQDTVSLDGANTQVLTSVAQGVMGNAGDINITAGSLSLTNGAQLNALTQGQGNAGQVNINARERVSFVGVSSSGAASGLLTSVGEKVVGNGGGIKITTGSLELRGGAGLFASTFGQGNAGNVIINARDTVSLDGAKTQLLTSVAQGATGNAGDISITAGSLSLTNGAQLNPSNQGAGNAGNVNINARDTVSLDGAKTQVFSSVAQGVTGNAGDINITARSLSLTNGAQMLASVGQGATGNAGGINITAGSLSLANGAQLNFSNQGKGNAGQVNINAQDTVSLDGPNTQLLTSVAQGAMGNAGDINITAGSLSITNGAQLNPSNQGVGKSGNVNINARDTVSLDGANTQLLSSVAQGVMGNAGDINITTGSLSLTNSAQLNVLTSGTGNAGNVNINARNTVSLDGANTQVLSSVAQGATGNAGDINITAGSLSLTNGAQLNVLTNGTGNAGNVNINARDTVSLDGEKNGAASGVLSSVDKNAIGNGGNIDITTKLLSLSNGAGLFASTTGKGNAGNVTINASQVSLDGATNNGGSSGIFTSVDKEAVGNGGDINIATGNLNLNNGVSISTQSLSTGNAGNININVGQNLRADNSSITATAKQAGGGNITIHANNIRLRHDSPILSSVLNSDSNGNGGNISINSKVFVALEDSDILTNAVQGNGGNISINSQAFIADLFSSGQATAVGHNPGDFARFRGNGRVDISASSALGISGSVKVPDFTFLQNSLSALPANLIDTKKLLANSCLESRRRQSRGRFIVTGNGGLAVRPGDQMHSEYPTVSSLPSKQAGERRNQNSPTAAKWKLGDPVEEAQGLALTPEGQIVASSKAELEAIAQARKSACPYSAVH